MGDTRREYSDVFDVYVPIAVAIFVLVALALGFVLVRFRARSDELPRGRESNSALEGSFAVLIGAIVAALLVITYNAMSDLSAAERSARGPIVEVTAAKWNWRFDYPEYGISQRAPKGAIATLVVPEDADIRFRLTSVDVIHAFWVPERRFKRDAFPGRTTTFTLRFPDKGFERAAGECAQFCGLDHSSMDFNVNVLTRADFTRWVERRRAEAG